MQLARLKHCSADGGDTSPLRIWIGRQSLAEGVFVRQGLVSAGVLTSIREGWDQIELVDTPDGPRRLASDNPFHSAESLAELDSQGLARSGAKVPASGLLASVVQVHRKVKASVTQLVEDRSRHVPDYWEDATVGEVRRRSRKEVGRSVPANLLELIEIELRVEDAPEPGDELVAAGQSLGLVSKFVPDAEMPDCDGVPADLIISREAAERLQLQSPWQTLSVGKSAALAKFDVRAVGQSPRTLITKLPLAATSPHPTLQTRPRKSAAQLTVDHIRWLCERNLMNLAAEFASLKSDDVAAQRAIAQLMHDEADLQQAPAPSTPASLYIVRAELMALGLRVTPEGETALRLSPALEDELLQESHGEVKKAETLHHRSLLPEDGGMLASDIFGDEGDLYRFGHHSLAAPIVPLIWRMGDKPVLSSLLSLSTEQVEQIVTCQSFVRLGNHAELEWREAAEPWPEADEKWLTGGTAIRSLLQSVPAERAPAGLRDRLAGLVQDTLLLPPVFLRPLVLLDSGNFAMSDLNELYRRIISRSNRLSKLEQLDAPLPILVNERRMMQECADQLWGNELLPEGKRAYGDLGRPLVDLVGIVESHIPKGEGKRVDWSAQARIVVGDDLPDDVAELPSFLLAELRLQPRDVVLITLQDGAPFVGAHVKAAAGSLVRVSRLLATRLELSNTLSNKTAGCQVHRPLRAAARAEAVELVRHEPAASSLPVDHAIFEGPAVQDTFLQLAELAVTGEALQLTGPCGVVLRGASPIEFRPEVFAEDKSKPKRREVPVPPDTKPRHSQPSFEQIDQVVKSNLRRACVFAAEPFEGRLDPREGRVGGLPCLPPEIEWPCSNGKPLQFLAQLPLDPLQSMPDSPQFPAGSLLTIFWGDDWWSVMPATGPGPIFVVSADGVEERPAPAEDLVIAQSRLTPSFLEETPDWSEMCDLLNFELENPDPLILARYKREVWPQQPVAHERIKVGGWPHWIQGAELSHPFVAQLASDTDTELNFGDAGSLYFSLTPENTWAVAMQCY